MTNAAPDELGMNSIRWTAILGVCLAMGLVCAASAQNPAPKAKPEDLGLLVPKGPTSPGAGRRVVLKDAAERLVVGQVHVEVGDRYLVVLPSCRLTSVTKLEATITGRKFEPATKEQLIEDLTKEQFKGFRTRSTRRYVYLYNTSEPFYKATSPILETMYPALFEYCRRQKLAVEEPETPLVAIMFRTQAEFDEFRRMPPGVAAYYNGVSNHVVMYEQSRLTEVAPELTVKQSISTIAHEGVHQILHNIGVQKRLSDWPMWISEGLPEYFAPTQSDNGVRWKGVGLVNDLRHAGAAQGSAGRPTAGQPDRKNGASQGAGRRRLCPFLARQQQTNFFAYLREVSKREPLEEGSEDDLALFKQHFGSDLAELQTSMLKNLSRLPYVDPVANQTHYVAVLSAGGWALIMLTSSPASITRWRSRRPR